MYDVEEYLHLALHASANRNPHASLGYLKQALELAPENPKAVYLLAIQHAEIGLVERSIAGLKRALELDPKLEIARLQLGLLMIDGGRLTEGRAQFAIAQTSADPGLSAFADGMILALDGQIATAAEKMKAALAMPTANVALRQLMKEVLARLEKMQAASGKPREEAEPTGDTRVQLGAYGALPPR